MTLKELLEEHPELNEDNILSEDKRNYSNEEVKKFWERIRLLRYGYHHNDFTGIRFPVFESQQRGYKNADTEKYLALGSDANFWKKDDLLELSDASFSGCTFLGQADFSHVKFMGRIISFNHATFESTNFSKCTFQSDLVLFMHVNFASKAFFHNIFVEVNEFGFYDTTFHNDVDFKFSTFHADKLIFKKTKFDGDLDFSDCICQGLTKITGSEFNKHQAVISFQSTKFNNNFSISSYEASKGSGTMIFSEAKFEGKDNNLKNLNMSNYLVDFTRTKLSNLNFDGSQLGKLLLDKSYDDGSSFMHVKVEEGDRAAFRILKHFHVDIQDNIIANEYYAKEMEAYEKEAKTLDRIILWVGRTLSSHHQNWFLSILWIVYFGSFISMLEHPESIDKVFVTLITIVLFGATFFKNKMLLIGVLISSILVMNCGIKDSINQLAIHMNPLNILKNETSYTGIEAFVLFFRILIGFAIYHFIVSVRKFSGK